MFKPKYVCEWSAIESREIMDGKSMFVCIYVCDW